MKKTVKSIFIFSALILLLNVTAYAAGEGDKTHSNILSGKVIDKTTNESLAGVKIILIGTDKFTYSDLEGKFEFENIDSGTYSIECSYISYEEKVIDKVIVDSDNTERIEVKLASD